MKNTVDLGMELVQPKEIQRYGFWEGMYYKKRRVSIPDTQSLLTLNLIP